MRTTKLKGKASLDLISICKESMNENYLILISDDYILKSSFYKKIESFIRQLTFKLPLNMI